MYVHVAITPPPSPVRTDDGNSVYDSELSLPLVPDRQHSVVVSFKGLRSSHTLPLKVPAFQDYEPPTSQCPSCHSDWVWDDVVSESEGELEYTHVETERQWGIARTIGSVPVGMAEDDLFEDFIHR
ncbi:hypothetical protein KIPB_013204 [Kipferlia bialata]|uniref:Uncharacterized protein n=1 Tax=Kipferlia bialata TaxID=797122 RepID=A0A9K3DA05_9EUKA|nr:hypothetical protein KIPB_013204 [Kipferlia bialata]|eukprot:g13204.t1